jgi:hypothetical protein
MHIRINFKKILKAIFLNKEICKNGNINKEIKSNIS